MTLIIEIALGIVLGFLILTNLKAILAMGMMAVGGAVVMAIAGLVIYWGSTNPKVGVALVLLAVYVVGSIGANWIGKRTGLETSDILIFVAMLFMLLSATAVFSSLIYQWSSAAAEPLLYLFLAPIIALWVWFWIKALRHIRERKKPTATVGIRSTLPIGGAG